MIERIRVASTRKKSGTLHTTLGTRDIAKAAKYLPLFLDSARPAFRECEPGGNPGASARRERNGLARWIWVGVQGRNGPPAGPGERKSRGPAQEQALSTLLLLVEPADYAATFFLRTVLDSAGWHRPYCMRMDSMRSILNCNSPT